MLTLYHAPRSRGIRILWLLEEIGAPFELKLVDIRRGDGSGARDDDNPHPHGKVPALDHNGRVIFETTAIALYLTDLFPQADLGPRIGDKDRGDYLSWLAYYGGVFEPSLTASFLKLQHIHGTFAWAPFEEVLELLGRTLASNPYLLGNKFSAVDIVFGGSMQFLIARGMVPGTDVFKAYSERVTARPAFARAQARDTG